MRRVLCLLTLCLGLVLTTPPARADENIYLIVGVDDSNSMYHKHYSGEEPHAYQQARALLQYLSSEFRTCDTVNVLYFTWAREAGEVMSGVIGDGLIDELLVAAIESRMEQEESVRYTYHWVAYEKIFELAESIANEDSFIYALVTTDARSELARAQGLGEQVPDNIRLFVLTYGGSHAADFADAELRTPTGAHIHAETIDQATYAIADIFNAIANANCSSM